jgi:hypothetical protein
MAKEKEGSLTGALSKAIKGKKPSVDFSLESFKASKNLSSETVKFKEQKWIPLSAGFQNVLQITGIPMGHITVLRGHSDTGKTTAMLETAVACQKMGILPVLIITEMKWSWEHARQMGLEFTEVPDDKTGEVKGYDGFFLYIDREKLNMIEDVSAFISDCLDEQKRGNLPYDLCFLWDSVGSIPCKMSVESKNNNAEWNAGAMSTQFGNFINQQIVMSRKEKQPYTNTLVVVNKVWVRKAETRNSQPKLENKGGNAMYSDASLVITFGNVANSGTNKISATKNKKTVEFAKRTKLSCDKNHITGVTAVGKALATVHGFIMDDKENPKELEDYKKAHKDEWLQILGSSDFDIVEEESDSSNFYDSAED